MSENPRVTVFMPVYNGEKHLKEAIDSILNQTYTDFEFLIINDGSTDSSVEIIESYTDPRIRLVHNEKNLGLTPTLNRGLEIAKGEYIVRMDADDISLPERIKKQVKFMDENPDVGLSGTWYKKFWEENKREEVVKYPTEHDEIKAEMFFNYVMLHPTIIINKNLFQTNGLRYDETFHGLNEDHDLFVRASFTFKLGNIPEVLFLYRQIHISATGAATREHRNKFLIPFFKKNLSYIDTAPSEEDINMCLLANHPFVKISIDNLNKFDKWLNKILEINNEKNIFDDKYFKNVLGRAWYLACWSNTGKGLKLFNKFWSSTLSRYNPMNPKQKLFFTIKCLISYNK